MSDENLDNETLDQEVSETEQPDVVDSPESVQDEATDGEETAEKSQKKTGFQKRIDELTREKYEAQAQAKFFAEQLKAKEQPQAETKAAETPSQPKADDFDTYEDFIDALSDWKVDRKLAERDEATKAKAADNSKAEAMKSQQIAMQTRIAEGRSKYDDFDSVALNPAIPVTQTMAEAIADSTQGADLAYYLGANLSEAALIAEMSPIAALRAIGKLEAKLEASPVHTAEKSKAPAPIKPVAKGAKATVDPNSMSIDEWMEWRNKQKTG